MTGLFNKEYLDTKFDEIWWSVIYIDIDNFKELNDTYGHCIWDYALQLISKALKESVRYEDKICRLYWDEFMILVNTWDAEEIKTIQERIQQKINEVFFEGENKITKETETINLSVSLWAAIWDYSRTVKDLLKESDSLMLENKETEWALYRLRHQLKFSNDSEKEKIVEDLLDNVSPAKLVKILAKKVLQTLDE